MTVLKVKGDSRCKQPSIVLWHVSVSNCYHILIHLFICRSCSELTQKGSSMAASPHLLVFYRILEPKKNSCLITDA